MELGSGEVMLILLVALLVYGGRLPEVARAVGKSMAELKRGLTETKEAVRSELDPGLHVDLEDDEPPRDVRRIDQPAPPAAPTELSPEEAAHLATEDVSEPPPPHEHPN